MEGDEDLHQKLLVLVFQRQCEAVHDTAWGGRQGGEILEHPQQNVASKNQVPLSYNIATALLQTTYSVSGTVRDQSAHNMCSTASR